MSLRAELVGATQADPAFAVLLPDGGESNDRTSMESTDGWTLPSLNCPSTLEELPELACGRSLPRHVRTPRGAMSSGSSRHPHLWKHMPHP